MNPKFRCFQRWLTLIMSLSFLIFSGSAMLHLLMLQSPSLAPPKAPPRPVLNAEMVRVSPSDIIEKYQGSPIASMKLIDVSGRPFYQIQRADRAGLVYLDASDGAVTPVDNIYAAEIATAYLGESDLEMKAYLQDFDDEYTPNFRILPVQRFHTQDGKGTRVYVSTATGNVVHHTDHRTEFSASIFNRLHRFGFASNKSLQNSVTLSVTCLFVVLSILGVASFFITGRQSPA